VGGYSVKVKICSKPHAKDEPYCINPFDKQFIQGHDHNKRTRADNQVFQRNGHASRYNIPAREQNYGLVEDVKGEDRLVGIGEYLAVEI
jgi:hypothetical protein